MGFGMAGRAEHDEILQRIRPSLCPGGNVVYVQSVREFGVGTHDAGFDGVGSTAGSTIPPEIRPFVVSTLPLPFPFPGRPEGDPVFLGDLLIAEGPVDLVIHSLTRGRTTVRTGELFPPIPDDARGISKLLSQDAVGFGPVNAVSSVSNRVVLHVPKVPQNRGGALPNSARVGKEGTPTVFSFPRI